jgi:hypothetical protein
MDDKFLFLLRVEAVNLASIISDTGQISVRRGGSLMALNSTNELLDLLPEELHGQLEVVAAGASISLFQLTVDAKSLEDAGRQAEQVRQKVEEILRTGSLPHCSYGGLPEGVMQQNSLPLKFATYVVDVGLINGQAEVCEQLVTAKNRWRQMQQPSMSLEKMWESGSQPCGLDRVSTGTIPAILGGNKSVFLSPSVHSRLEYGRIARQDFYQREIKSDKKMFVFTDNLQELSSFNESISRRDRIGVPQSLLGRIAVFYVDGNQFGRKGRETLQDHGIRGYKQWSAGVREHHRKLLGSLLELTFQSASWRLVEKIRLETMLWGGDEILWVVPAWKGWELARWFFRQPHRLQTGGGTLDLTYACGLVFCRAKDPIDMIKDLALQLGKIAKAACSTDHRLAYEVLESRDQINSDLLAYRRGFGPVNAGDDYLVINPVSLDNCWEDFGKLEQCESLPIRQLYKVWDFLRKGQPITVPANRVREACREAGIEASLDRFLNAFGGQAAWIHLVQMIPYLATVADEHDE